MENTNEFFDSEQRFLQKRLSPTIWSNLNSKDRFWAQYAREGFLQSRLSEPSVDEAWIQNKLEEILVSERPGKIFERDSLQVRSQFDIHHQFPEIIQRLMTNQILQQAKYILGSEPLLYQSHINFKNAGGGGDFEWHSDFTYWRDHDGMCEPRAISIIRPLSQHGPQNGGLQILRGSHQYYYPSNLRTNENWKPENILHDSQEKSEAKGIIDPSFLQQVNQENLFAPSLKLGDYLIMDANSWHSSPINFSSTSRPTLFVILISQQTDFDIRKLHHRPHYISCREGKTLQSYLTEA